MLNTGLRNSEIRALRDTDIDLKNRQISISKALHSYYEDGKIKITFSTTKNGRERYVPINNECYKNLVSLKLKHIPLTDNLQRDYGNLLFPYHNRPMKGDDLYYIMKCIHNGMIKKDTLIKRVTPHMLRHSFATTAIEMGVDALIISRILGHKSISTTANYYVHMDKKYLAKEMKKLK